MQIGEREWKRLPPHLQALFRRLPNPGSDEVVGAFPETISGAIKAGQSAGRDMVAGDSDNTRNGGRPVQPKDIDGSSGSAARFFKQCKDSQWDDGQQSKSGNARTADECISLQSEAAVSALRNVVDTSAARLTLRKQSYRAQNTSVSGQQLRLIFGSVTEAIQNIERRFSLGLPRENITVQLGHAICVATQKPTGITTITIDLLMSGRFAEVVTFDITEMNVGVGAPDSGRRLFYSAKADKDDRLASRHPTVKPVDLMAYLCRLVCPPGGTVLDPFAGSGSTGMACMREGFDAILIEREAEYVADIKRRIAHVLGEDAPLFAGAAG